jgi:hypothetical protein
LDALGNWSGNSSGTYTTNRQNQVTAVGTSSLTYDNNGNMTTDAQGNTYTYDAWGHRMVYTALSGGFCIASYGYDALDRRIVDSPCSGGAYVPHDLYYSKDWQMIEEKYQSVCCCCTTTVDEQYVWGDGYVDNLVLRDRSADGSAQGQNSPPTRTGVLEYGRESRDPVRWSEGRRWTFAIGGFLVAVAIVLFGVMLIIYYLTVIM